MTLRTHGFTLVELLVAMAVLAALAAVAYGGLNGLIRQHELASAQVERMAALQRTMAMLAGDLLQVQPRAVREPFHGDRSGAFVAGPQFEYPLEFTRGGWSNPGLHRRSTLQRVAWRLDGDRIVRLHWSVVDRAPTTPPVVTPLSSGVARLAWRFLDHGGEWQDLWPALREFEPDPDALPRAVELRIELENGDELTRTFALHAR